MLHRVITAAMRFIAVCCMTLLGCYALAGEQPVPDLWLYCPTNLLVDENLTKIDALFVRAE